MAIFSTGAGVPQVIFDGNLDFANVAADTVADQTVTVNGINPDMPVKLIMPSLTADLVFCNEHASALNTLKVRFYNPTIAGINPAIQRCIVLAW